ncbi:MAG: Gfo/Idh/MocA family oxidoreductase [Lachnospiraceae bacterium]|nr:Gfo/Idh/MocA family oxidoreductase [Lachnospiraceae bacterium]
MKKLRIGMVGAGNIAKTHLTAYQDVPEAEIVAICDTNVEKAKATAAKFGIEKVYASETEMLANEQLDAADVCVWNVNHAVCSIEALNAGLHVLCEKPMATSAAEAEQMIEAAKKNNRLLMIGFVVRFCDESRITMDFINNGYLGDIYYSKATYLRRHGAPGGWFCDSKRSAGGPVIDLGVHVIDITRYMMGKPKALSVYASTSDLLKNRPYLKTDVAWKPDDASKDDVYDVEDFAVALIKYEGNKTTLLETSYSLNGQGAVNKELFGTKGGIKLWQRTNTSPTEMTISTVVNDYLADITPDIENYIDSKEQFTAEMAHFVDCCLNGTECNASAEDGLEIMKILDAIYESARTGHEVVIK